LGFRRTLPEIWAPCLPEIEMKVTIRSEITTDWKETETFEINEIDRRFCKLEQSKIGLSLAEG
jgi:hypothetical protein